MRSGAEPSITGQRALRERSWTTAQERLAKALAGRYTIDGKAGQGGMATVYRATDLKHHRPVALKVLRPELAATIGPERFLREIEVSARLQHPHIVPLYDSGDAAGVLYYVMPFVEGESLRDRLTRDGRVPFEEAVALIREVASALAYAHQHGIVHRDIKPENILLSGGHAVVADFGIARALSAAAHEQGGMTGLGIAIGTPAYMSPEQATASQVDARSDQYSLACVFFEIVTGATPFAAGTVQAVLTQSLTGPRPRAESGQPRRPGRGRLHRCPGRWRPIPGKRFDSVTTLSPNWSAPPAEAAVPSPSDAGSGGWPSGCRWQWLLPPPRGSPSARGGPDRWWPVPSPSPSCPSARRAPASN